MAHINFLEPPRFSLRQLNLKNFELNYLWMMVIAGILVVVMIIYGVVQQRRISTLNGELTVALAAQKGVKKPAKPGAPQKPTLMDALQQRVRWAPILNAIANHTPDTISLNYIKGSSLGNRSLQIEGVGADVLAAARYEDELATVPFFSKVELQSSAEKAAGAAKPAAGTAENKVATKTEVQSVVTSERKTQLTFEIQGWLR